MSGWRKIGIIAGGGGLPIELARYCARMGAPYFMSRIDGSADAALDDHPGETFNLGEVSARKASLRTAECDAVVIAGIVMRPDYANLKLDEEGAALAIKVATAGMRGDDAMLRALIESFESSGFKVVGAHEVAPPLMAQKGVLGAHSPDDRARGDIAKAAAIADAIGVWDIGQAISVCNGYVLALEAAEGTDALVARVASLPVHLRGAPEKRRGILLKRPKPTQERRIDMPTIGLQTIENAGAAGLAGIALEAEGALIVDRDAVIARADELGMFLIGFDPKAP